MTNQDPSQTTKNNQNISNFVEFIQRSLVESVEMNIPSQFHPYEGTNASNIDNESQNLYISPISSQFSISSKSLMDTMEDQRENSLQFSMTSQQKISLKSPNKIKMRQIKSSLKFLERRQKMQESDTESESEDSDEKEHNPRWRKRKIPQKFNGMIGCDVDMNESTGQILHPQSYFHPYKEFLLIRK